MHEIGIKLLKQQADSTGIPLTILEFDLTAPSDEYKKVDGNAHRKIQRETAQHRTFW